MSLPNFFNDVVDATSDFASSVASRLVGDSPKAASTSRRISAPVEIQKMRGGNDYVQFSQGRTEIAAPYYTEFRDSSVNASVMPQRNSGRILQNKGTPTAKVRAGPRENTADLLSAISRAEGRSQVRRTSRRLSGEVSRLPPVPPEPTQAPPQSVGGVGDPYAEHEEVEPQMHELRSRNNTPEEHHEHHENHCRAQDDRIDVQALNRVSYASHDQLSRPAAASSESLRKHEEAARRMQLRSEIDGALNAPAPSRADLTTPESGGELLQLLVSVEEELGRHETLNSECEELKQARIHYAYDALALSTPTKAPRANAGGERGSPTSVTDLADPSIPVMSSHRDCEEGRRTSFPQGEPVEEMLV